MKAQIYSGGLGEMQVDSGFRRYIFFQAQACTSNFSTFIINEAEALNLGDVLDIFYRMIEEMFKN